MQIFLECHLEATVKRGSGGVCIFIDKDILPGVVKIKSKNVDCIWVKMSKQFFNTARDIYICCCYVPPSNSTAVSNDDNLIDVLQNEIAIYDKIGDIIIMGDLNCRIGNAQEQWVETTVISDSNSEMEFEHVHLPVRFNQDNKSNCYGTKLMELLNASHLLVVNGRTPGDMIGLL